MSVSRDKGLAFAVVSNPVQRVRWRRLRVVDGLRTWRLFAWERRVRFLYRAGLVAVVRRLV